MTKVLPFDLEPYIKSYQFNAYPLGILKATNHNIYEYCLYNKFITIFYEDNIQFYVENYESWGAFKHEKLGGVNEHLLETVIENINSNKYLHLTGVNEYYIPKRAATNNYEFLHDLLVIGYDGEDVVVVGYNNHNVFEKNKFSCYQLSKALSEVSEINLLEVENKNIEINYKDIMESLEVYFTSEKPKNKNSLSNSNQKVLVYGVDVINKLILKFKIGDLTDFFHNILVCVECKKLILDKLRLVKNNLNRIEVIDEYQEIKEEYEKIRIKTLKKVFKNSTNFEEELNELQDVYHREKQFAREWIV